MSNIKNDLALLDQHDSSLAWSDVLRRTPGQPPQPPQRNRGLIAFVALGLAAASFLLAVRALGPREQPPASTALRGEIAFVRGGDVYVMEPDGTGVHKLATGPASFLAWSPDGRTLAFARGNRRTQIYVVSSDGAGLRRLTSLRIPGAYFPMWSEDGSQIAFYGRIAGHDSQLGVMSVEGSKIRRISLPFQSTAYATHPVLSPDFGRIAFSMCRGPSCAPQIYVRPTEGGDLMKLTEGLPAVEPVWSPDGRRLAFVRSDDVIMVMDSDGTNQKVVHECAPEHCLSVGWSPDGKRLLVTQTRHNPDACRELPTNEVFALCQSLESHVYVVSAGGGQAVGVGPSGALWPTWQPLP